MTTTTESTHHEAGPAQGASRRRRVRVRHVVLVLVVLAIAWGIAVTLLVAGAAGELLDARESTAEAQAALDATDPAAAAVSFAEARDGFASAEADLRNPVVAPARALPVVGRNLRAVTELASGGALVAGAGADLTETVTGLPGGLDVFAPRDGAVPIEPIERLAGPLAAARSELAAADARVATAPAEGLLRPVADARADFVEQLDGARGTVDTAAALFEGLPAFLGAEGPKRYLFGAQNPAELRGTGGLVGAFSILTIDEGRLDFDDFSPIQDLPILPHDEVEAPNADYAARYGRFGGAGHWQNVNMTPDFPSAATAMERSYEAGTGDTVDGVILADPMALSHLLRVAGPTQAPAVGTVDADNVVAVVANEAYAELTSPSERKRLLGDVAAGALGGFLENSGDADPAEAVGALADAVAGGHLLVHATDPDVQEALAAAGVSGGLLDPDGDFLAVVGNNTGMHKADFYTDREVRYDVWLQPDGSAAARATVRLSNGTPAEGPPRYVIGPNAEGLDAGDNRTILSVFCARGCEIGQTRREGDGHAVVEEELGHPVVSMESRLASGEAETFQVEWTVPDAWTPGPDGTSVYRLTVQDQPTIRPTALDVAIRLPDGSVLHEADPDLDASEDALTWSGEAQRHNLFEVRFGPPAEAQPTGWERVRGFLGRPVVRIGGESAGS